MTIALRVACLILVSLLVQGNSASGRAPTPEEQNGCGDAPDTQTAEELCGLYKRMDTYYGRDIASWFPREGEACKKYFTVAVRSRNIICAYKRDTEALALRINAEARNMQSADGQQGLLLGDAAIHNDARQVHQKYADQLGRIRMELIYEFDTYKRALQGSEQFHFPAFFDEAYCRGGQRSKIPSFWLAGIYRTMKTFSETVHDRFDRANLQAWQLASEGAGRHGDARAVATRAAETLAPGSVPSAPNFAPSGDTKGHLHQHHLPTELAIRGAADKATEVLVERGVQAAERHLPHSVAGAAPGLGKLAGVLIGIGFEGFRGCFKEDHGQRQCFRNIDAGTVISAGIGVFGFVPGLAATGAEVVIRNDAARKAEYRRWGGGHLSRTENQRLNSQQLSQAFCQHLEEDERQQREAGERQGRENAAQLRQRMERQRQMQQEQQDILRAPRDQRERLIREYRQRWNAPAE